MDSIFSAFWQHKKSGVDLPATIFYNIPIDAGKEADLAQPSQKRPLSALYVFFYLIFWPDTWRIVIGLAAAWFIAPRLAGPEISLLKTGMLFVMLAAIGYVATSFIDKPILKLRKRFIQLLQARRS